MENEEYDSKGTDDSFPEVVFEEFEDEILLWR
jgi:hypothetical protein